LVYYKFFNVKDPNDTIGVYIQTEVWNLGINDISTTRSEIGPVYPNPANEKVTVEYNIVNDVTARLVLRNMLGSTIRDEAVSGIGGKVQINTTDLPEGIYFCSLFIDGKSISTRKLVIRH
jgi:hypothetical protein